jgi:hypothetical protein
VHVTVSNSAQLILAVVFVTQSDWLVKPCCAALAGAHSYSFEQFTSAVR